jgi:hypothetical protein
MREREAKFDNTIDLKVKEVKRKAKRLQKKKERLCLMNTTDLNIKSNNKTTK